MTAEEKKAERAQLARSLGLKEMWLRIVFNIESGDNPAAQNPTTKATGLIQFMPSTLAPWGLTTDQVKAMSYPQQLQLVYKYLNIYKPHTLTDLYLAIFYPYAIKKGSDYILGSERGMSMAKAIFNQNPGFKTSSNASRGYYTKRDITNYVMNYAKKKFGYTRVQYYLDKFL